MAPFKYDLYSPLELAGSFRLAGDSSICGGKLNYSPGHIPTIDLFLFDEHRTKKAYKNNLSPYIHGFLDKHIILTALNTSIKEIGVAQSGNVYGYHHDALTEYLVLGCHLLPTDEIAGIDVKINLWQEFRIFNSHIDSKKIEHSYNSVKINGDTELKLCEHGSFTSLNGLNGIIGTFSNDDAELLSEINTLLYRKEKEYNKKIFLHKKVQHEFYIRIKKRITINSVDELEEICSTFCDFLTAVTGYPTTPTAIDILIPTSHNNIELLNEYSLLTPRVLKKELFDKTKSFWNGDAPITFDKIKDNWEDLIKNFFANYSSIREMLYVIKSNFLDANRFFGIPRTIELLKYCGQKKGAQYSEAIQNYATNKLKKIFFDIYSVESFEEIGEKISATRNYVVHKNERYKEAFDQANRNPAFLKYIELLIYSYVQKKINLPDELRTRFQEYWIARFSRIGWLKFKPS